MAIGNRLLVAARESTDRAPGFWGAGWFNPPLRRSSEGDANIANDFSA